MHKEFFKRFGQGLISDAFQAKGITNECGWDKADGIPTNREKG